MGSFAIFLALAPFVVGAAAGLVRTGPPWRFQLTQLAVLVVFTAGWFVSRVESSDDTTPAQVFAGWFVVIALPIAMTFVMARATVSAPRWVSIALIGPTVFFMTALIAVGAGVMAGLVRF